MKQPLPFIFVLAGLLCLTAIAGGPPRGTPVGMIGYVQPDGGGRVRYALVVGMAAAYYTKLKPLC